MQSLQNTFRFDKESFTASFLRSLMLAQIRLVLEIDDDTLRKQIEYKPESQNQYLTEDRV